MYFQTYRPESGGGGHLCSNTEAFGAFPPRAVLWFSVIACLFLILSQALVECGLVDRYGNLDHQ